MDSVITITNEQLGISIFLMVFVGIVAALNKLGITKSIAIGTFRSFIQLTLMGFVLKFIFNSQTWYFTVIMLVIMYVAAAFDSYSRLKIKLKKSFRFSLLSMFIGSAIPLIFLFYFVLKIKPWYVPQYIIPVSSMIISNAMTCNSLVMNNFGSELSLRKFEVETLLSFGLSPKEATLEIRQNSIRTGLTPSINALMVLGLAKLPGMMTGQIIGGVEPIEAVKYQLFIMYMIATANVISSWLLVNLLQKSVFNRREQLIPLNSSKRLH